MPVTVNLTTGIGTGPTCNDTLHRIEDVTGSLSGDDLLIGDPSPRSAADELGEGRISTRTPLSTWADVGEPARCPGHEHQIGHYVLYSGAGPRLDRAVVFLPTPGR